MADRGPTPPPDGLSLCESHFELFCTICRPNVAVGGANDNVFLRRDDPLLAALPRPLSDPICTNFAAGPVTPKMNSLPSYSARCIRASEESLDRGMVPKPAPHVAHRVNDFGEDVWFRKPREVLHNSSSRQTSTETATFNTPTVQRPHTVNTLTTRRPHTVNTLTTQRPDTVNTLTTQKPDTVNTLTIQRPDTVNTLTTRRPNPVNTSVNQRPNTVNTLINQRPDTVNFLTTQKPDTVNTSTSDGDEVAAASNYSDLPAPSTHRETASDVSFLQYDDARPRPGRIRRSLTSPESFSTLSDRATPALTPSVSADNSGSTKLKKGSNSVRKSFDAFLKATKKRFNRKSRQTTSPGAAAEGRESNARPSTSTERLNPASVNSQERRVNPIGIIVPVMNMGPGEHTLAVTDEFDDDLMSMPHIRAHTTVDYLHCLVPELTKVTNCGFYWGVMDRYEAEALLDNKPEGTFLLRDSSQDDFIFSVSFRRYGRSLHARVEQWHHKFSFDAHDSGVYKADSVTTLIEHYKDPQTCMFFEPMLTLPLNRPHTFSLLHLARAVVCDNIIYDSIDNLPIPKNLQQYLRYYHYKQKIRVRTHSNSRELHNAKAGWV